MAKSLRQAKSYTPMSYIQFYAAKCKLVNRVRNSERELFTAGDAEEHRNESH